MKILKNNFRKAYVKLQFSNNNNRIKKKMQILHTLINTMNILKLLLRNKEILKRILNNLVINHLILLLKIIKI